MASGWVFLTSLSLMLAGLSPISGPTLAQEPSTAPVIFAAGVPRNVGERATNEELFGALARNGVSAFLPFFQFQEVPESASLDRGAEFFPPCDPDAGPFPAMRQEGIGLIVPGGLLWPAGQDPSIGDTYLEQIVRCAGADGIAAVFSVDEPALYMEDIDAREAEVQLIYERSKALLPDVPVLMIHGPIMTEVFVAGAWIPATDDYVATYLANVERLSKWSDIVGFDAYMIPTDTAKISAPGFALEALDWSVALPAYVEWIAKTLSEKQIAMILQAFGYADLVGVPADATSRQPTADELLSMACVSWSAGATTIGWWGQSHLDAADHELWTAVLDVSRQLATDPDAACIQVNS